jgi:hypothetical protein
LKNQDAILEILAKRDLKDGVHGFTHIEDTYKENRGHESNDVNSQKESTEEIIEEKVSHTQLALVS